MYAFDLIERRIKKGIGIPDAKPRRIDRVGVVGAGLMATQLATLFLRRLEVPVVITDIDAGRVEEAVAAVRADLEKQVARGRLGEGKARFLGSIISGTTDTAAFAGCGLVIEAVFEEIAVKQEVFAALEEVVSEECLLVTNTSSLSVSEMAARLRHPERVVGMHFFNPVAVMPLVEVVRADRDRRRDARDGLGRDEEVRQAGRARERLSSFVVNRLLTRQSSVLMQALENGNTFEETDEAVLRIGIPMPPSACSPWSARGSRTTCCTRCTTRSPTASRSPDARELRERRDGHRRHRRCSATVDELHERPRGARRRGPAHARRGRHRVRGRDRRLPDPGSGLPVLPRRLTRHLDQSGASQRVTGTPLTRP